MELARIGLTLKVRVIERRADEWAPAMQDSAAAVRNGTLSSSTARNSTRRAIVLRSVDEITAPAVPTVKKARQKTVWLDPPWPVLCILNGEAAEAECVVLAIWDGGATLRARDVSQLTEFDLQFSSGPRPVRRRCKRSVVRGNVMDVEFSPE